MAKSRSRAVWCDRRGKSATAVLLIIALVVIVGGGGVVVGSKLAASRRAAHPARAKRAPDGKTADKTEGSAEDAAVVDLGEFLVNLSSAGGDRYLRAEVSLRVSGLSAGKRGGEGGAARRELPADEAAVAKDCVTTVLSSGDFQQLRTTAGRARLKALVVSRLQEALPQLTIHDVLFTSFVMQ